MKNTMPEIYRLAKTGIATLSIAMLLFAYGQTARAELAAVGPVDPVTGFPGFFQDAANLQLGPCDHEAFADGANNPPCGGLALIDPVNGGGFVADNIEEVSFYRAEANMDADGQLMRLRMEVQGGVLGAASVNNAVRLRMRNMIPGTYTVDHPFGQETVVVGDADIDMELPGGVLASAPNFDPALKGNIMCFWGNGTGLVMGDSTFLGDGIIEQPLIPVAVAACPQLAGDLIFRVSTLGGDLVAQTNLFAVEGKISPLGVRVQRATYEQRRNTAIPPVLITKVDVWAASVPGELIPVSGAGLPERDMVESAAHPGNYYFRKRLQSDSPAPLTIDVNGVAVPLVDEVTITKTQYRVNNNMLTVKAKSSDQADPPMLTVLNQFGDIIIGPLPSPINETINISPDTPYLVITVESEKGGTDTQSVDVVGGNAFQ